MDTDQIESCWFGPSPLQPFHADFRVIPVGIAGWYALVDGTWFPVVAWCLRTWDSRGRLRTGLVPLLRRGGRLLVAEASAVEFKQVSG